MPRPKARSGNAGTSVLPGLALAVVMAVVGGLGGYGSVCQAQPAGGPGGAEAPPPAPAGAVALSSDDEVEQEREITLYMVDGQRFTGLLVDQTAEQFVVRIGAIKTTFKAERVERFRILSPVQERYRELRRAVDESDPEQMANLIEWLRSRRQLGTALAEAKAFLERVPTNATIARLKGQLEQQVELRRRSRLSPRAPEAGVPGGGVAAVPVAPAAEDDPAFEAGAEPSMVPLLSEEQIKLMRVFEVDLSAGPRVEVPRATVTAMIERFADDPMIPSTREGREEFYRRSGPELLGVLFRLRARDLYPQVRVVDQPASIRRFRDDVFRAWMASSCATSECHGGAEAGRLILPSRKPGNDSTVSTALYILQQYRTDAGEPLLNFGAPEQSRLLQLALPRGESRYPHPPVMRLVVGAGGAEGGPPLARDVFKPALSGQDDRRFAQAVEWLKSMYQPRPDYLLDYQPQRPFYPVKDQTGAGGAGGGVVPTPR